MAMGRPSQAAGKTCPPDSTLLVETPAASSEGVAFIASILEGSGRLKLLFLRFDELDLLVGGR